MGHLASGIDTSVAGAATVTGTLAYTVDIGTLTGGDYALWVGVFFRRRGASHTLDTATWAGNNMTDEVAQVNVTGNNFSGKLYKIVAPTGGSQTLNVPWSGSTASGVFDVTMVWWVGNAIDQATPSVAMAAISGNASTLNLPVSITITGSGTETALVFSGIRNTGANYTATPTNYTERSPEGGAGGVAGTTGDGTLSGGTLTTTTTWNTPATSTDYITFGVRLNAAGGGPSFIPDEDYQLWIPTQAAA